MFDLELPGKTTRFRNAHKALDLSEQSWAGFAIDGLLSADLSGFDGCLAEWHSTHLCDSECKAQFLTLRSQEPRKHIWSGSAASGLGQARLIRSRTN